MILKQQLELSPGISQLRAEIVTQADVPHVRQTPFCLLLPAFSCSLHPL